MKKSLELMRAERELRAAASKYTDVICDHFRADMDIYKVEQELYAAARAYARLAELVT